MTNISFIPIPPQKVGERIMESRGLRMDGTWSIREPMRCGLCGGDEVILTHDSLKHRVRTCADCGGVAAITKGATSWWHHDWKHFGDLPERFVALIYDEDGADDLVTPAEAAS